MKVQFHHGHVTDFAPEKPKYKYVCDVMKSKATYPGKYDVTTLSQVMVMAEIRNDFLNR